MLIKETASGYPRIRFMNSTYSSAANNRFWDLSADVFGADINDDYYTIKYGSSINSSLILSPESKAGVGKAPAATLDVNGKDNWDLGNGSVGDFRVGNDTYNFRIGVALGGGGAGTVRLYGNVLMLGGNGLDKVIITSTGMAVGGNFPTYALECKTNSTGYGFANYSSDNLKRWEQYTSTNGGLYLYANGNYRGYFDAITGAYTSVSDKIFKKNIISLGSVLDKVANLQPSSYEYIENNPSNRKSIGLIAQDLETVFPEFVYKSLDEKTGKEVYSVDYAGMSVIALKAIQEQQILIKDLQAEILKLKK